jgi:hypothetical protein
MLKYYQFKAVELHDELLNSQEKLEKILKVRPSLSHTHFKIRCSRFRPSG